MCLALWSRRSFRKGFCGGVDGVSRCNTVFQSETGGGAGYIREVHWSADLMGGVILIDTAGPTLRGAARCRTLQEGPRCCWTRLLGSHTARSGQEQHTPGGTIFVVGNREPKIDCGSHCEERPGAAHSRRDSEVSSVDLGTLRRHHGLWVWITTCARGLDDLLGRFCDTIPGPRGLLSGLCVW